MSVDDLADSDLVPRFLHRTPYSSDPSFMYTVIESSGEFCTIAVNRGVD